MDIQFFYKNNQRCYKREVIITSFAKLVSQLIDLPDTIEVCVYPLSENVYGGIDAHRVNRLALNSHLPYEAIPKILTHELIHVSQKHLGTLRIDKGVCYWRNIPYSKTLPEDMRYEEYLELPWEVDVENRLENLIKEALRLYNGKI